MKLTVTIVLLLRSINGSICLQLQVKTLSTVQLRHNPLQLGLCGSRGSTETGRHKNETTDCRKTRMQQWDVTRSLPKEHFEAFVSVYCLCDFGSYGATKAKLVNGWLGRVEPRRGKKNWNYDSWLWSAEIPVNQANTNPKSASKTCHWKQIQLLKSGFLVEKN